MTNNSRFDPLPEELVQHLPAVVREELDEYEQQIKDFRKGQIGDIKMQKIRLQLGTYAQRQPGVQMQRIKIPYGELTPAKLRRLAYAADKYASGFMHLTTRQDVQLYYILLETVPNMMRELADAGITTREACGNTIRNVTASPFSGTSPDDVFDVTPYADAFVQFMLRNPICQNMGRKFKVAFESSGVKDDAGLRIHDLGFRAQILEVGGRPKRGFQVWVGGGLGSSPMLGHLWTDFLPEEELIPFSAAVVRIFDRYGERKSRMKARMKFLIKKLGMDKFRSLVEAERKALDVDSSWNAYLKEAHNPGIPAAEADAVPEAGARVEDDPQYLLWKGTAVTPQNTGGHALVQLLVHNGDLPSDDARKVADIAETFSGGDIRITIHQNLVLRGVPLQALPSLFVALRDAGLDRVGAETITDITACPGADTCRLGITSAKGLATALDQSFRNGLGKYAEMARDLKIKISGCPNACAQHTSSNIGFQGAATTKDGRRVPSEMVYVGGALQGSETTLAESIIKIPTRNAPKVVEKLLILYDGERQNGESFNEAMSRLGKERLKSELEEFTHVPSFEQAPEFYKDWGHEDESFELLTGVKGECAGATVEEKEPSFGEAEASLQQAEAHLIHKDYEVSVLESYHAMANAAHVPLYSKLVDPFTPAQTTWEFENLFVRTGEVDDRWLDIHRKLEDAIRQEPTEEHARAMLEMAREFYEVCREAEKGLSGETVA
ncbi:hypothetical protein QA596_10295 [Balneolales bacterium ANBcel1]|nr:hypothetical protein [Balneolales bacterium ANBcel1]